MKANWIFKESQRPLCAKVNCVQRAWGVTSSVGCNLTPIALNAAYDCNECGEQWEGY